MSARLIWLALIWVLIFGSTPAATYAGVPQTSWLEADIHRVRFGAGQATGATGLVSGATGFGGPQAALLVAADPEPVVYKSPLKAFLFSAVLPGAGQFYLGSRLKALVFLGVEATAWGFEAKYRGDGDTRTDQFEDFNRTHWHRADYEQYLAWNYPYSDDTKITAVEISHHLPKTETQQYFEMTGKYNQFAWGWDDANYAGNYLSDYNQANPPPRITGQELAPVSDRRVIYEGMRHEANQKYSQARKMVAVAIVNHLVSGFEAMFAARRHNNQAATDDAVFGRLNMKASLKSYATRRDTPFVQFSYKF